MVEVVSETMPVARKLHRCDSCETDILVGETYFCQTLQDGHLYTLRYHPDCRKAEIEANKDYHGEEWSFLWEVLEDGERDARMWLAQSHPTVATRFGISVYEWCDTSWWIDSRSNPYFWRRVEHVLR